MTMESNHSPESTALADRHYEILSDIRRSVRYHDHRRRFYLDLRSAINFVTIIAGSASVASAFAASGIQALQWMAGAFVAFLAAIDLVVGTVEKATLHTDLYRRFIRLEKRMLTPESMNSESLTSIELEQLDIEMVEPPVYHALNRSCQNELLRSEGRPELFLPLSWFHRTFRNFLHFPNLPATQRSDGSSSTASG